MLRQRTVRWLHLDVTRSDSLRNIKMSNNPRDQKLIPIEEALDRRINQNGMVEYLVKLHNEDKMEWVPWTNVYSPQLMDNSAQTAQQMASSGQSSSPSSSGIIDI